MYLLDKEMREAGPPKVYDNTMLTQWLECCRKFYYFWRGLDYLVIPSYFAWGRAWQEGMSAWYGTKGDIEVRLKAALAAAEKDWNDSGAIESKNDTLENLKYLLMFYAVEYEYENFDIIAPNGEVELGFEFPAFDVQGVTISLAGAIDGYFQWAQYGVGHLENKSTGMYLSDQYMSQWGFSPQVTQYHWGLWKILTEEPFGCLMNCVSKRLTQKQIQAFLTDGDVPEGIFMRNLEKRSEFELAEFERSSMRIVEDVFREWDRWEWPKCRDPIHCVGGIGKSPCLFKRHCLSDVLPWEMDEGDLLGGDMVWRQDPWEPWKRGGRKDAKSNESNAGGGEPKAEGL